MPDAALPPSADASAAIASILRRVAAEAGGIPGLTPSERRVLLGAIPRLAQRLAPHLLVRSGV